MTKSQLKLYLEFMLIKYNNYKHELWDDSIYKRDYWCIKALLEDGYDVHKCNDWALRWACYYGHYKIAKLLIYYGANVDETLKYAKYYNNINAIKFLEKYKNGLRNHLKNIKL